MAYPPQSTRALSRSNNWRLYFFFRVLPDVHQIDQEALKAFKSDPAGNVDKLLAAWLSRSTRTVCSSTPNKGIAPVTVLSNDSSWTNARIGSASM